jgi:hypothetical protein
MALEVGEQKNRRVVISHNHTKLQYFFIRAGIDMFPILSNKKPIPPRLLYVVMSYCKTYVLKKELYWIFFFISETTCRTRFGELTFALLFESLSGGNKGLNTDERQ